MSNNQPPKHPVTLQQLAGIFGSMTQGTAELLGGHPGFVDEVRNIYLSFLTSPTTIKLLGYNPTVPNTHTTPIKTLRKEILDIKASVTTLSNTVKGQKPKAGASRPTITHPTTPSPTGATGIQGKEAGPKQPSHTYASKAATNARPSVVINLEGTKLSTPPMRSTFAPS